VYPFSKAFLKWNRLSVIESRTAGNPRIDGRRHAASARSGSCDRTADGRGYLDDCAIGASRSRFAIGQSPAKRRQAAALVKEGISVSLSREADTEKAIDNPDPFEHRMIEIGTDRYGVVPHGVAHTHLDSLAHIHYGGVFYNGYKPDADSVMKNRHTRNSIINLKNGIFTRGILVDLPRLKGVPYLEPGTPVYAQDIEAWEKIAGVKVSAGDALFIRTGRWARRTAVGPFDTNRTGKRSGPSASMIPWLRQRDVALLGADVPPSLAPSDVEGETGAVHDFALVYLGVHIFDNVDLEALAEAAQARKRWEFLLTVAPLAIRGGTGSPANPIATF
jgi:kynurenine formamidase